MAILYTQLALVDDKKVIVSAESPLSRHFETKYRDIFKDIEKISERFQNETHFCSAKSSYEGVLIYFKRFKEMLIISAVEVGLSKTSVSLFLERLRDRFVEEYGEDADRNGSYVRFEEVIREESKRFSKDRGMEETIGALQETKEVCIKNYTNVIQRGHKIEQLEMLSQRLQGVSEKFRKRSRKMHIEAVATQYLFYVGLAVFLFLAMYFFMK